MRVKRFFSEAISNLKLEEVRSEFQRSYLLISLFSLILVIAVVNFFLLRDSVVKFYGGVNTFLTLVVFIVVFLLYQSLVLQYLKIKLRRNSGTTFIYKFIHTMIEISFPTTIIFYMMSELRMLSFIDSPVSLTYFVFIILSILHLDFKVNIFAGVFAAMQYAFLVYYGFNYVDYDALYASSTPENSHYIRAVVLVFSGAAAAFVSRELKNRITSTIDFQEKKNELELLFEQQVSKEVSKALLKEKGVTKGNEATVMFLDVRNFTAFADTHTPEEVIDYQNKFLGPVIDIINQHQGVVFQILGDGLMACFGSPGENVLHADMAFQASLKILKQVQEASTQKIIPPTTIGIGLHSGLVVSGNIGNESRKQFSISGSPVIIASRIEQLNKKYRTQLLISGQVFHQIVKGKMDIKFLGEEPLRGIGTPVEIYSVS
ncbi:adenylate/guanylate cyclase domain-containing protein [Chryseolinea sp. H1M3-3]|uniref:adenylate/guanylate cyclase domain-containing protein n=1 Tax=Chryseolinea sp. H1M3-3 TaxID=3034144 RepID=UPI0023EDF9BA|nr:adenylate/guanylate cyclase domain-containing protein [Chryseolinea sp. H1M3-3]